MGTGDSDAIIEVPEPNLRLDFSFFLLFLFSCFSLSLALGRYVNLR